MSEGIVVVAYDDAWPVLGLDAKPIVDIQISVASFEPLDAFRLPIAPDSSTARTIQSAPNGTSASSPASAVPTST